MFQQRQQRARAKGNPADGFIKRKKQ
jgi:hypothetical protein